MSLGDALQKKLGVSDAEIKAASDAREAEVGSNGVWPVAPSAEFTRISNLPKRELEALLTPAHVEAATNALKTPGGKMVLRPRQAACLIDAQRAKGLMALLSVGEGKALVSFLLPEVLDCRLAVILVPPQLVRQTELEYQRMGGHWALDSKKVRVVSYSTLSSPKNGDIIDRLKPDLIIADEASNLKHRQSVRTKRLIRYLRQHPETTFCVLSGTLTNRSLHDFSHLSQYSMKEFSPVPFDYMTLCEWADCLDSDVKEFKRRPPGVLKKFCVTPQESPREGFRRRLNSTQGVISSVEGSIGTSLVYSQRDVEIPANVQHELDALEKTWARPDGEELQEAMEKARVARQLACGFWYKWEWLNGVVDFEWLQARSEWHKAVRAFLQHRSQPGLDSPLLVANAVSQGRVVMPQWHSWAAVKDRKQPPTVAVWVDEYLVEDAVKWGNMEPGVIWYEHEAFGEAVARRGGFRHFGGGAEASSSILGEDGTRTIVASIKAHGTGKNLQVFNRNLISTPPSSGATWEQLVGRTHRQGQTADEVYVDVYLHTEAFRSATRQALSDARYIEQTTGQEQKLCRGTVTWDLDFAATLPAKDVEKEAPNETKTKEE